MAEHGRQEHEPVGSVAEETARLVEALGGWAEGLRTHDRAAADDRSGAGPAARDDPDGGMDESADAGQAGGKDAGEGAGEGHRERRQGTRSTTRCEHCGAASRAGEALTCQLCPVCQGIALLRTVRPETVERLADLAAALSGALRDVAADRFGQAAASHPPSPPPRGHRVQDIAVDDEDDPRMPPTDQPRRTQESTAP